MVSFGFVVPYRFRCGFAWFRDGFRDDGFAWFRGGFVMVSLGFVLVPYKFRCGFVVVSLGFVVVS